MNLVKLQASAGLSSKYKVKIRLWSTMYDAGISMAARVFTGSYVRDNYPGKLPLLPQYEGSK
ncbi:hypothetical protein, partial [Pontibacter aquaedesilientis]|uniref:hypothetical protein n=1 Tax=Pontibacter aquaedesilientis TaxID=2766980 RepID=UPI001CD0EE38